MSKNYKSGYIEGYNTALSDFKHFIQAINDRITNFPDATQEEKHAFYRYMASDLERRMNERIAIVEGMS